VTPPCLGGTAKARPIQDAWALLEARGWRAPGSEEAADAPDTGRADLQRPRAAPRKAVVAAAGGLPGRGLSAVMAAAGGAGALAVACEARGDSSGSSSASEAARASEAGNDDDDVFHDAADELSEEGAEECGRAVAALAAC
jgi:hypothetical protein